MAGVATGGNVLPLLTLTSSGQRKEFLNDFGEMLHVYGKNIINFRVGRTQNGRSAAIFVFPL